MASWILIPCLVALRAEFNRLNPDRDKGADGSIGDTAHAAGGTSDHLPDEDFPALRGKDADAVNEVHALDIDSSGPWPAGLTMDKIVQHILGYCRRANSDPLNEPRLRYVIWNRKIYRAPNWTAETYTGTADPHTNHAHFSAEYVSSLEADTSTWHLEDLVAVTPEEIVAIADAVWNRKFTSPYDSTSKFAYDFLRYAASRDTGGSRAAELVDEKLAPRFATLAAALASLDIINDQELAQLAATILAGLPAGLAKQVAHETLAAAGAALSAPPAGE